MAHTQTSTERIIPIHTQAPPKPALGAPCNGCGVCCLFEPCPLGVLASRKRSGACHLLQWDDTHQRYHCGAVAHAATLPWPVAVLWRRLALRWIAAGAGCDSTLDTLDALPPP